MEGQTTPIDTGNAVDSQPKNSASPTDMANGEGPAVLDFRSETVGGEAFDGADLAGKPTVFWFWVPRCAACLAQIPVVSELADVYGEDVNVVGVGSLDDPEAIEEFANDVSPAVTLLADPDGAVWKLFAVSEESTYLVLDENGTEKASGHLDDAELAGLVSDLAG